MSSEHTPFEHTPAEVNDLTTRFVVKFHDRLKLPYEDGVESHFHPGLVGDDSASYWRYLHDKYPALTFKRLYTATTAEEILQLINRAVKLDPTYSPANLMTYFLANLPPRTDRKALLDDLLAWPIVQTAYVDPPGTEPGPALTANDSPVLSGESGLAAAQSYLNPAPEGIDARWAWNFKGGDGKGKSFIDLERGWTLDHEDLIGHGAQLLHGVLLDSKRAHGTRSLGVVCAADNNLGVVGIVPHLKSVNVVSWHESTRSNAMMKAITVLTTGDVLLLESQIKPDHVGWWAPLEAAQDEFDTIRLATALGITVVEPAGNSHQCLDDYLDPSGNRVLAAGVRDSLAIMVGAAVKCSTQESVNPQWVRHNSTNYGTRVDCFACGERVRTCDSTSSPPDAYEMRYTDDFSQTSAASAIIAGAALAVQGMAEANLGRPLSPEEVRKFLCDPNLGTQSCKGKAVDLIGVMPDLKAVCGKIGDGSEAAQPEEPVVGVETPDGRSPEIPKEGKMYWFEATPVEDALHQALVAFGSGTQQMYVKSDAIKEVLIQGFGSKFIAAFNKDPKLWDQEKLFVLECARSIGRLAAQKAIAEGRIYISKTDVFEAREQVIKVNQGAEPGAWCQNM